MKTQNLGVVSCESPGVPHLEQIIFDCCILPVMPPKKIKSSAQSTGSGSFSSDCLAGAERAGSSGGMHPTREKIYCSVCDEEIKENVGKQAGDEAVECEGVCGAWLHRKCAGLSKAAFDIVCKSPNPFYCSPCKLGKLELELKSVRDQVTAMASKLSVAVAEIASFKGTLAASENNQANSTGATPASYASAVSGVEWAPLGKNDYRSPPVSASIPSFERRCNVIIGGVGESPRGTSRVNREKHDFDEIMTLISSLDSQIGAGSVRDHLRLGKFNPKSTRPRQILVRLTRVPEVSSILSKRGNIQTPLSVRPDLSPYDRRREAALMKERWTLMQSGVNKSEIKIRGSRLLVRNKLHAQFREGSVIIEQQETLGPQTVESNVNRVEVSEASLPKLADSQSESFLSQANP